MLKKRELYIGGRYLLILIFTIYIYNIYYILYILKAAGPLSTASVYSIDVFVLSYLFPILVIENPKGEEEVKEGEGYGWARICEKICVCKNFISTFSQGKII